MNHPLSGTVVVLAAVGDVMSRRSLSVRVAVFALSTT
jgi:hypothetical protein